MIKRSISISNPAHLRYEKRQLIVCQWEKETNIPLEDLAAIILEHPQITLTHSVLSCCAEAWVIIIGCDGTFRPISLSYPLYDNAQASLHIHAQIEVGLPARKHIWQSLIKAKIQWQAAVLKEAWKNYERLSHFADSVRSGDPDNLEAQAARHYWTELFGENFRRIRDGDNPNPWLNYGYAILRACLARAVVWWWLSPVLWIHHSNQFNPFNLVDDLIEPFRPLVDIEVYRLFNVYEECEMTPEQKLPLLWILTKELDWNNQKLPIFTAFSYYAASYRWALTGNDFHIPKYEII